MDAPIPGGGPIKPPAVAPPKAVGKLAKAAKVVAKPAAALRDRVAEGRVVSDDPNADRAVFANEPIAPKVEPKKRKRFTFSLKRGDRSPRELSRVFRHEVRRLKDAIGGRDELYRQPWVLLMGPSGSGKTSMLASTPLVDWSSRYAPRYPGARLCGWWCSRRGIVLDLSGDLVAPVEGEANDRAWRRLLRLLRRHRYRRPIDGAVIAVSAGDLIGPERLSDEDLARRADAVGKRLAGLARGLSMTVPAYLVITQCDRVTGFSSFARRVPGHLEGDMFGWSAPTQPDIAYATHWVDDAFASLGSVISPAQLEMLAASVNQSDADDLFVLPTCLDELVPGVRAYADRVFRGGESGVGLAMRGIYFTGDAAIPAIDVAAASEPIAAGPVTAAAAPAVAATAAPTVAVAETGESPEPVRSVRFAESLFFDKVFPEASLAQPVARGRIAAHRGVLATQIGMALIGVFSLLAAFYAFPRMQHTMGEIRAKLDSVRYDLLAVHGGSRMTSNDYADFAEELLDGLIHVDSAQLTSPFYPSSYFFGVHDTVEATFGRAFSSVIVKAMYHQLNAKAHDLQGFRYRPTGADTGATVVFDVEQSVQYRNVKVFAERMAELEKHVALYNDLPRSRSVRSVADLVYFLFRRRLPASFLRRGDHYGQMLEIQDTLPFEYDRYADSTANTARVLLQALEERMFHDNPLILSARAIIADLTHIQSPGASGFEVTGRLQDLTVWIKTLHRALRDTSTAWIAQQQFAPTKALSELLGVLDSSSFTGISHPGEEFLDRCYNRFAELKTELRSQIHAAIGGPLIEPDEAGTGLRAAAMLDTLHGAVDELLAQRFMLPRAPERLVNKRLGGLRVFWSNEPLAQGQKLVEMYNNYAGSGLPRFPQRLQAAVTRAMKAGTDASLVALVNAAQRTEPDYGGLEYTQREIKSIGAASSNISMLMTQFESLQLPSQREFVSALSAQCEGMLADLSRGRDRLGLYTLDDDRLRRWVNDPDAPFVLTVFEGDQAAIADRLAADRAALQDMVDKSSEPLVGFMASADLGRSARAEEWRRIATELHRFETKVPSNSVSAIDRMFLDLDGITEANFRERLTRMGTSNYFLVRREIVRRQLDSIFTRILIIRARLQYNDLAEEFNAAFVGRFPFADFNAFKTQQPGSASLPAITGFIRRLDAFNATYDVVARRWGRDSATPAERAAYRFLDSLRRVRAFLAPLFDTTTEKVPSLPVEVELRVNQVKEIEGKDIIDWALEIGEQSISTQEYVRRGRVPWRVDWKVGDRMRFTLRWAANSDVMPREIYLGNGRVHDRSVEYTFNISAWSLLHLLSVHRAPAAHLERGAQPNVLEFNMGTIPAVSAASAVTHFTPPTLGEARVFLRVTPIGRGRRDTQTMPTFPTTNAPEL